MTKRNTTKKLLHQQKRKAYQGKVLNLHKSPWSNFQALCQKLTQEPNLIPSISNTYPSEVLDYARLNTLFKAPFVLPVTKPKTRLALCGRHEPCLMVGTIGDINLRKDHQASLLILNPLLADNPTNPRSLRAIDSHLWIDSQEIMATWDGTLTLSLGDTIVFMGISHAYYGHVQSDCRGYKIGINKIVVQAAGINVVDPKTKGFTFNLCHDYPRHGDWILNANENFKSINELANYLGIDPSAYPKDSARLTKYMRTARFNFKDNPYGSFIIRANECQKKGKHVTHPEDKLMQATAQSLQRCLRVMHLHHFTIKQLQSYTVTGN